MVNEYGIDKKSFYKIINVFTPYAAMIEKVILFGSRARGDYKEASDIDLAIKFRRNPHKLTEIMEMIETEAIIYTVDFIDYNKITNEKLKQYIDQEGKVIFLTNLKGEILVTTNKLKDKAADLKKAFNKLKSSALRDPAEDDIVIDATIQRFEFTYELSWKLMKAYLEYNGHLEATSPRKAIRESFKEGLIQDGNTWLEMLQDRNRTSHTYDEACALEIFENIKNSYLDIFQAFITTIEKEL